MRDRLRGGGWRTVAGAAIGAALLVPLLALGGPAFARTGRTALASEYPSSSQYQYPVTICHRTHSWRHPWIQITVSSAAVRAHLRHGDTTALPCPTGSLPQPGRGHGHDHSPGAGVQPSSGADDGGSPGRGGGHGGHGHP